MSSSRQQRGYSVYVLYAMQQADATAAMPMTRRQSHLRQNGERRDLSRERRDLSREQRDLNQERRDLSRERRDLSQERRDLDREEQILSEERNARILARQSRSRVRTGDESSDSVKRLRRSGPHGGGVEYSVPVEIECITNTGCAGMRARGADSNGNTWFLDMVPCNSFEVFS